MKTKPSRAFSLVELSIIILIVGIIIAGVTEGSRLLKQMRLSTARNLTTSSDIRSIENMILWLDATSETSLTTDSSALVTAKSSGDLIYNWDDQNPQVLTSVKPRFSQATSGARPTYTENGINNLPTLFFNADSSNTNGDALAPTSFTFPTSEATVFIVMRPIGGFTGEGYIFDAHSAAGNRFLISAYTNGKTRSYSTTGSTTAVVYDDDSMTLNNNYISSLTTASSAHNIYRNGTLQDSVSGGAHASYTTDYFSIGSQYNTINTYNFDGYISEIIMFDRVLSTEERGSVTKYLGKKYAIAVS